MVNIKGLRKAAVLAGLYNASRPSNSALNDWAQCLLERDLRTQSMTEYEAELFLKTRTKFDSIRGRILKVDLSDDGCFDEQDYDQANGQGSAQKIIDQLLEQEATSKLGTRIQKFNFLMGPALHLFPSPDHLTNDLKESGFFSVPASTKYHGAFEGGLFEHSRNVTEVLVALTRDNGLKWQRDESPYIIGMFHDLCKIDLYRHPESNVVLLTLDGNGPETIRETDTTKWEHNPDPGTLLSGMTTHGQYTSLTLSFGRTMQT